MGPDRLWDGDRGLFLESGWGDIDLMRGSSPLLEERRGISVCSGRPERLPQSQSPSSSSGISNSYSALALVPSYSSMTRCVLRTPVRAASS